MKAYIAAPLFSAAERDFNVNLDAALRELGMDTYLPQRDNTALPIRNPQNSLDEAVIRKALFRRNIDTLRQCEIFIVVLDGRIPDEGVCFELGAAYAYKKPLFGLQTDQLRFPGARNNLMIETSLGHHIFNSTEALIESLRSLLDR